VMLNMNPLGDNGVMLSGIGQVIVVAITLFIQIKKRVPERTLLKYRFYVGFLNRPVDYIMLATLTRR
jgi:uncharacterized radical SAM superfamily protein